MKSFNILALFSSLLILFPFLYFDLYSERNEKISFVEAEIASRVTNLERMADFIAQMPAIVGAIEFQSFGQIEIMIERLLSNEKILEEFIVFDADNNIIYSKKRNYRENSVVNFSSFTYGEGYTYLGRYLFLIKKIDKHYFLALKVSYWEVLSKRFLALGLKPIKIDNIFLPETSKRLIFTTSSWKDVLSYWPTYFAKNLFKLIFVTLFMFLIISLVLVMLIKPFQRIVYLLQNLSNESFHQHDLEKMPRLFYPLFLNIISANKTILEVNKVRKENEIQQSRFKIAQQVAHDIRSPLEVLKSLKNDLSPLPEEARRRIQLSINRIEEIAYNLLKSQRNNQNLLDDAKDEELLSLLASIIHEKKIEYGNVPNIVIKNSSQSSMYGSFAKCRRGILKSIISNLINNSVEAINGNEGLIEVQIISNSTFFVISITDNGSGIQSHQEIFKKGFSTKKTGNGIGLFHAKSEIESYGGTLTFESSNSSTSFFISLPRSPVPKNHLQRINLYRYEKVIVLDDDVSFHEIWRERFKSFKIRVEYITSVEEMFKRYESLMPNVFLISDFELMDPKFDGIQIIQKLQHTDHSFLVTARDEEKDIQDRCIESNIRILPKTQVRNLQIFNKAPLVVLIDDEKYTHLNWAHFCKNHEIEFRGFETIDNFLYHSSTIDKYSYIFVDSSLSNNMKGEIESKKIFDAGFEFIYLSTGYEKSSFDKPFWIKDIFSKSPNVIIDVCF